MGMTEKELTAIEARMKAADESRYPNESASWDDVETLIAEVRRLRAALVDFGNHTHDCVWPYREPWKERQCNCGYAEFIAPPPPGSSAPKP